MDYTELFLGQYYFLPLPSIKDDFQSVLRSLCRNVYKHKPHSMVCESMLLITNHMPSLTLRPCMFFSNSLIIDLYSCKVISLSDKRKNKTQSFDHFASIMAVVLKLWKFNSCKSVMSYMNQKKRKQTLESAQDKLEIILKSFYRCWTDNSTLCIRSAWFDNLQSDVR